MKSAQSVDPDYSPQITSSSKTEEMETEDCPENAMFCPICQKIYDDKAHFFILENIIRYNKLRKMYKILRKIYKKQYNSGGS